MMVIKLLKDIRRMDKLSEDFNKGIVSIKRRTWKLYKKEPVSHGWYGSVG